MLTRFGYVAMALQIAEGSPNKTVTVTNLLKIPRKEDRLNRLRRLAAANLDSQLRVLKYNKGHEVQVFRFTSKLIPLATHQAVEGWDYLGEFRQQFLDIGAYVKDSKMRVSAHPDHFTLLNSPKAEVVAAALKDLAYHAGLFDAMGLGSEAKLVLHVGGLYKEKALSIKRFKENFALLPDNIKKRLIIENDDKSYTAADVLKLCQEMELPMVLDVHHHDCCNSGKNLGELLPAIFATWRDLPPKIHFSSLKII